MSVDGQTLGKSLPFQVTSPCAADVEGLGSRGLPTAASCGATAQMEVIFIGDIIPEGACPSTNLTVNNFWASPQDCVCVPPLHWPGAHLKKALPHSRATLTRGCKGCTSRTQHRAVLQCAALRAAQEGDALRNQSLSHFCWVATAGGKFSTAPSTAP